ncbi:MAG: zinc-dependent metalloprotease [Bacteriovoracaceae bacterium]|nr:zinc-dependent metalloprotease [Bacteriovoracaceae bacterium]
MSKLLSIFIGLLLIIGCAKERETQLVQSTPDGFTEISTYQDKEFDLLTLANQNGASQFSTANNAEVEGENIGIRDFRRVSYTTSAPLFEDVPLIGKQNTKYKLKYEVTNNLLIISKISEEKDLPYIEKTVAEKLQNGTYKIPLISYSVTLYKLKRELNVNNEATHQLFPVVVSSITDATHMVVNPNSRTDLDAISKNNVFSSDIFAGEWFYAATVVSASPEKANSIGRDVSMDFMARSVSRIKFEKRPKGLVGYNLNTDDNINTDDDINLKEAINIPAVYFDIKIDKYGNTVRFPEEKVNDEDNRKERVPYDKRSLMELDFRKVLSAMTKPQETVACDFGIVTEDGRQKSIEICRQATKPGLDTEKSTLDSIEIGDGFMAFVVYHETDKVKIRYAFRKAHSPIEGRVYFKDDRKTFGFFGTTKFAILNESLSRQDAREKLTSVNRFYPENGRIVYYFSKTTPDHMKEAGRASIKAWDEAFQKAGTNIRVVLDESKTVNLGDIRYNIINIVDTKDGARLLGYGPSIVDSESGEIISATSNIYANPFRESWIRNLRNYIRSETGIFEASEIGVPMPEKMTYYKDFIDGFLNNESQDLPLERSNSLLDELGIKTTSNLDIIKQMKQELTAENKLTFVDYNQKEGIFHNNSFDKTYKETIKEIKEMCGEEMDSYISTLNELKLTHTENEMEILNGCADKLLEKSVIATLIHELGHNFGLRHNFIASTDTKNFFHNEDGTHSSATSSVMDYQPDTVKELLIPGPYDIAAIRFGYANKVLLENGEAAPIDIKTSLAEQVQNKSMNVVKYKFCTDEDVQRTDPLCQRHDVGTNPLEIVKNTMESFYSSYTVYGHRYDRAVGPSGNSFGISHLSRTFIPLKQIYDQWRFHLKEFLGERDQYLENLNIEEYKEALSEMKSSTGKYADLYNLYYEASELAYNFIKNIVFKPAMVCVGKVTAGPDTNLVFVDFEKVKENVFANTGLTIDSCDHVAAIEDLKAKNLDYQGNFGLYYEDQKETLDIADVDHRLNNVVGFGPTRRMALAALTMRVPMMDHLARNNFRPNFLDNPIYREEIIKMTFDRILLGLDGKPFGFENRSSLHKLVFTREKGFLKDLAISVVKGTLIPNNLEESDRRENPFSPNKTTNPNQVPKEGVSLTQYRYIYIFAQKFPAGQETAAQKMIEKRQELKATLATLESDIPEMNEGIELKTYFSLKNDDKLKTIAELMGDDFTFKSFVQYLSAMIESAAFQEEAGNEDVAVLIRNFILPLNQTFQGLAAQFSQEANAQEIFDTPIKTFLTDKVPNVEEFLKEYSKEGIRDALMPVIERLKEVAKVKKSLLPFRDEAESQLDLLTEILLAI